MLGKFAKPGMRRPGLRMNGRLWGSSPLEALGANPTSAISANARGVGVMSQASHTLRSREPQETYSEDL
jgi:hypothetical protein